MPGVSVSPSRVVVLAVFELFLHLVLMLQLFIGLIHQSLPVLLGCAFLISLVVNVAATLLLLFDRMHQKIYTLLKSTVIGFILALDIAMIIHLAIAYIWQRSGSVLAVLIGTYVLVGPCTVGFSIRLLYDVLEYNEDKAQQQHPAPITYVMHGGPEPSVLLSQLEKSDTLMDRQPPFNPHYQGLKQENETELDEYEAIV